MEDYKTIRKSVSVVRDKVEKALAANVNLDKDVLDLVERECERLEAERDLRY